MSEAKSESNELLGALERVASDLPEGWTLSINVERGAAWVSINDENGNSPEDFDDYFDDTTTWKERVFNALAAARASA